MNNICVEFLIDSNALQNLPGYGWCCVAGDKAMVPFSTGVRLVAHDIAKLVNPTPAAVKAVENERQEVVRLRAAAALAESARAQREFIPAGDNWLRGGSLENARRVAVYGLRRG